MDELEVRARSRRRRPLMPHFVAVAVVAAAGTLGLQALIGDDEGRRGFLLEQGADVAVTAEDSAVVLDHPVDPDLEEDAGPLPPAAMAASPWFTQGFQTAQGWSFELNTIWRPTSIFPILDFVGDDLSVRSGVRATWTPPPCGCPTVRIWMYGGSTAYGLNQRDHHTIASELAKIADPKVRLEVTNHGVLGYLHWLEAERFAYDLTLAAPPDVVLFYDGANDGWATNILNNRRSGDQPFPIDPTNTDVWGYTGRAGLPGPSPPPGARFVGWDRGITLNMEQLTKATIERYDRSRIISRSVAELHGIEPIYVWQPSRYSRDLVKTEPHGDATQETYNRTRDQMHRDHLADDVIDLVDVFDDSTDPIFTDDVHHNELGARLVAEAIYANIADELHRIVREREGGR
jgi:hypothetical protein